MLSSHHPQRFVPIPTNDVLDIEELRGDGHRVRQGVPDRMLDAHGVLPPGALCAVVDHALGIAIIDQLGHDERTVTTHLHVDLLSQVTTEAKYVECAGEFVGRVASGAVARGMLVSAHGQLLGHCSSRFAVRRVEGTADQQVRPSPATGARWSEDGGSVPVGKVHRTLGTRVVADDTGRMTVKYPAPASLGNHHGGLHGGIGALMGERANELALTGATRTHLRTVELRVAFVRPVPADGRVVYVRPEVVHLGRSLAVTRAVLSMADGRPAVIVDQVYSVE